MHMHTQNGGASLLSPESRSGLPQALPDTLLERTYTIATDALVSMPETSITMRAATQRRGGLLALLRRKVMGGGARAALLADDGAGSRRRRGAAGDAAKLHADDTGNAATDDGLILKYAAYLYSL